MKKVFDTVIFVSARIIRCLRIISMTSYFKSENNPLKLHQLKINMIPYHSRVKAAS